MLTDTAIVIVNSTYDVKEELIDRVSLPSDANKVSLWCNKKLEVYFSPG